MLLNVTTHTDDRSILTITRCMCGILLIASGLEVACESETHSGKEAASPAAADFAEGLGCRGPDHAGCYSVGPCGNVQGQRCCDRSGGGTGDPPGTYLYHSTALIMYPLLPVLQVACGSALFEFHGSLLQLRGTAPSHTPLVDASGNVLVFNGQVRRDGWSLHKQGQAGRK